MDSPRPRETTISDRIISDYGNGADLAAISTQYGFTVDQIRAIVATGTSPAAITAPSGDAGVPAPARRRPWTLIGGGVVLLMLLLAGVTSVYRLLFAAGGAAAARPSASPTPTAFEKAQSTCDSFKAGTTISDGGKTLLIDSTGKEDYTGVPVGTLACLMNSLGTPDAVVSHIDSTRALDGRQEDSWGEFTASWSYHPDQGLDMIVRAR